MGYRIRMDIGSLGCSGQGDFGSCDGMDNWIDRQTGGREDAGIRRKRAGFLERKHFVCSKVQQ
jgi:hypothetical protein